MDLIFVWRVGYFYQRRGICAPEDNVWETKEPEAAAAVSRLLRSIPRINQRGSGIDAEKIEALPVEYSWKSSLRRGQEQSHSSRECVVILYIPPLGQVIKVA
ncbi:hypothetical protein PV327_007818 [Microctonus hyperodae]|uniref:Uncharacterized protein n=1 Tax=Microctonus hyperodae TaxID=165561 RepID=A0AA39KZ14_MICHY|nr:hypothetical protein PV327_007818 [Microctonus hyperodae]